MRQAVYGLPPGQVFYLEWKNAKSLFFKESSAWMSKLLFLLRTLLAAGRSVDGKYYAAQHVDAGCLPLFPLVEFFKNSNWHYILNMQLQKECCHA